MALKNHMVMWLLTRSNWAKNNYLAGYKFLEKK